MNTILNSADRHDIETEQDIETLVNAFYGKVRKDDLLAPIFNAVIQDNWDAHLQKMYDFWGTLLLYTRKYNSDPMNKHMPLPLEKVHFDRWLMLFSETIEQLFAGDTADAAKKRAVNISRVMQSMMNIRVS